MMLPPVSLAAAKLTHRAGPAQVLSPPLPRPGNACTRCTIVHIIRLFRGFEWDEDKARDNLRKHGLDFADATAVLEDEWERRQYQGKRR